MGSYFKEKINSSSTEHHEFTRDQFESQQKAYHRHGFYTQGESTTKGNQGDTSQSEADDIPHKSNRGDRSKSFTGKERKSIATNWENAFFGRVHFEEGMHQRYSEACAAEEEERRGNPKNFCASEQSVKWSNFLSTEDSETPLFFFHRMPAEEKLAYIIDRLTKGERRIRFAPDYGSLTMMAQLNLGELLLNDAEILLNEMKWMTPALQERIVSVKAIAAKIKYDYDLD